MQGISMTRNGCLIIILSVIFVGLGLLFLTSLKPAATRSASKTATSQQLEIEESPTLEPISSIDASAALVAAEEEVSQLRNGLTQDASASQTAVANTATQHSWEQTEQIMQIKIDSLTSNAGASATTWAITSTPLARAQKQEQQLEGIQQDMQPFWEWTKIGFTWLFGFLMWGAANRIFPALAERLRPQPQVIQMQPAPEVIQQEKPAEKNFRLHVNERTPGGYSSRNFVIPCSIEQFSQFCDGIVADRGKNFAEARWVRLKKEDKKPFSYHEFTRVRAVLLKEKLIMQVDPSDSRKGFIATDQGLMVFTKWATGNVDDVTFQTTPPP